MQTDSLHKEMSMAQLLPVLEEKLAAGESVGIYPKGTSMLPMLRQGIDWVVLSPLPKKLKKYDLPLYRRADGSFVLHRIVKTGDTYTCVGDNQFHLELGVGYEQMIAVVTAFYRGERCYGVSHPAYWLYCRIWHYSRFPRRVWRWGKRQIRRLRG